ncbi:hypothetical protein JTE90_027367 [Oedothorax gibbosus]|uniref:Uncharacterized protein n=1 Tax=Oedothorax gibbosus TaxID=931172 RepID=A0AAV6W3D5_9ARAC|nr:hypothetical protein JTE90_027367 [Oedothorax gibbosus]
MGIRIIGAAGSERDCQRMKMQVSGLICIFLVVFVQEASGNFNLFISKPEFLRLLGPFNYSHFETLRPLRTNILSTAFRISRHVNLRSFHSQGSNSIDALLIPAISSELMERFHYSVPLHCCSNGKVSPRIVDAPFRSSF